MATKWPDEDGKAFIKSVGCSADAELGGARGEGEGMRRKWLPPDDRLANEPEVRPRMEVHC